MKLEQSKIVITRAALYTSRAYALYTTIRARVRAGLTIESEREGMAARARPKIGCKKGERVKISYNPISHDTASSLRNFAKFKPY